MMRFSQYVPSGDLAEFNVKLQMSSTWLKSNMKSSNSTFTGKNKIKIVLLD